LTTQLDRAIVRRLLLTLTTIRRLCVLLFVFLAWAPAAYAWTWPVQGPVLQPFVYDEAHPYASGQHRGIDIGADAAGESVVAPAAGTVSFAGSVPTNGESVTIETADGYSVTLTHLGSIAVAKGATVAEGQAVATIGPSGTPEFDRPYLHLGIRVTSDPNGYLDPLRFLPAPAQSGGTQGGSTGSQTGSHAGSGSKRGAPARKSRSRVPRHERGRVPEPRVVTHPLQASQRPAHHVEETHARASQRASTTRARQAEPPSYSLRRPVVEPTAPSRPAGLDAGHELRPDVRVAAPAPMLLPLVLNGAAALVALAAALAAARRRRRREATPSAQVLHLPRPIAHKRAA
jgi:Peptidase family M23